MEYYLLDGAHPASNTAPREATMRRPSLLAAALSLCLLGLAVQAERAELPSLYIKPPTVSGFDKDTGEYLQARLGKGLLVSLTPWYSVRDTEIVASSLEELEKLVSNPANTRDILADMNRILNSDFIVTVEARRGPKGALISASLLDFASGSQAVKAAANVEDCDVANAEELDFYIGQIAHALRDSGYKIAASPYKGGVKLRVELGRLEELRLAPLAPVQRKAGKGSQPAALPAPEKILRLDSVPAKLPTIAISRDASSAVAQIARGLELLIASGDERLNAADPAKAEGYYAEVLKRAEGYAAYKKELAPYREGALGRIASARVAALKLRLAAADALDPEPALAEYRSAREAIASAEPDYAVALAELAGPVAARLDAARAARAKSAADQGDGLMAKGGWKRAAALYETALASLSEAPDELGKSALGLRKALASRLSDALSSALDAELARCDAAYAAGDYGAAAAGLRAAIAGRAEAGDKIDDDKAPFMPILDARLDAALRAPVLATVKKGDEALGKGDFEAARAAYAEAGKAAQAAGPELRDPAALAAFIAARQATLARGQAALARARADSCLIAGEFAKAEAAYGEALAILRKAPSYEAARTKPKAALGKDEAALLADADNAEAGAALVRRTVLEIFRNQVLSYRDRLLVLDVRSVADPALKKELRDTAVEAAFFILRNPSGSDAAARASFAEALGMAFSDPALAGIRLNGRAARFPFPTELALGGARLAAPAGAYVSPAGAGLAIAYPADLALPSGLVIAAGFPVAYRADGSMAAATLSRFAPGKGADKALAAAKPAAGPALFSPRGSVLFFVGGDKADTAFFLDESGKERLRCRLGEETALKADFSFALGDRTYAFPKGSGILVFGGGRYIAGCERPGIRSVLRTCDYAGPAVGDEAFVEGGVFWAGLGSGNWEKEGRGFVDDDAPVPHAVYLRPFWISRRAIACSDLPKLLGASRPPLKVPNWTSASTRVTFVDCAAYANQVSALDGLEPAYKISGSSVKCDFAASGWRLPTEAERELAARGSMPIDSEYGELCGDFYRFEGAGSGPAFDPEGPPSGENDARVVLKADLSRESALNLNVGSKTFRLMRRLGALTDKALAAWSAPLSPSIWADVPSSMSSWRPGRGAPYGELAPGLILKGLYGWNGKAYKEVTLTISSIMACGPRLMLEADIDATDRLKKKSCVYSGSLDLASGYLYLSCPRESAGSVVSKNLLGIRGSLRERDLVFTGSFLKRRLSGNNGGNAGMTLVPAGLPKGRLALNLVFSVPKGDSRNLIVDFRLESEDGVLEFKEGLDVDRSINGICLALPAGAYRIRVRAEPDSPGKTIWGYEGEESIEIAPEAETLLTIAPKSKKF
jgi:hypothetical protein